MDMPKRFPMMKREINKRRELVAGKVEKMKKLPIILLLSFILCLCGVMAMPVMAYEIPVYIRIGLTYRYKDVDTVPIMSPSVAVGYEQDGVFYEAGVITASAQFSMIPVNMHYVKLMKSYSDYASARAAADAFITLGHKAAPCLAGIGTWYVYLGGYPTEADAVNVHNSLIEETAIATANNRRTALMDGSRVAALFDHPNLFPQFLDAQGGYMRLTERTYRGRVEFGRYKGDKLTAVNVVPLEEYLYSVVPSEMPAGWHTEALKAQACAARNYAITSMGRFADEGYDLCDSILSQVYLGVGNEANSAIQAVNATKGMLILYGGKPINAVYFSSSGGRTENSENVWSAAEPYYRSVPELFETGYKEWMRVITLAQLDSVLTANGADIGAATGMYIGSYNSAGRVGELVITGAKGSITLVKEQIRTYFASLPGGSLESRNFQLSTGTLATVPTEISITNGTIQSTALLPGIVITADGQTKTTIASSGTVMVKGNGTTANYAASSVTGVAGSVTGKDIIITGKGWGHAVGMSQYGAKGMAENGYTFAQILAYYFQGVIVQ